MIDFKELPSDGRAFEQFVREILLIYDLHPQWSGQGPDQGRDILATETLTGPLSKIQRKWLVQCKHNTHSGKSVGRDEIGSVVDDCRQVEADAYLLVCSTQPSSALVTKLSEISANQKNQLATHIWDGVDIEKRLNEPRLFALGHLFFPQSFQAVPWKLFNRGAPNRWTAHFKDYFVHLSSRIAGSHPDLKECEFIISLLEKIRIKKEYEWLRPRAIYFDDKHQQFTVFADYLVPHDKAPSLLPSDFNGVLNDGVGLHRDGYFTWYITYWDIQVRRIICYSDHFHLDHYDYYNPQDGNYQIGIHRSYTVGELEDYGDEWR